MPASSADGNSDVLIQIAWISTNPCGSELARDDGGTGDFVVDCHTAIASRLTPTGDLCCLERWG
ncbi:hypothetical protein C9I50_17750 [Pseudomonas prosekii]|nr:hypothetical protein C9I50_17750 [Pseudomonas prosekii]